MQGETPAAQTGYHNTLLMYHCRRWGRQGLQARGGAPGLRVEQCKAEGDAAARRAAGREWWQHDALALGGRDDGARGTAEVPAGRPARGGQAPEVMRGARARRRRHDEPVQRLELSGLGCCCGHKADLRQLRAVRQGMCQLCSVRALLRRGGGGRHRDPPGVGWQGVPVRVWR